jgi:hypothetical protein
VKLLLENINHCCRDVGKLLIEAEGAYSETGRVRILNTARKKSCGFIRHAISTNFCEEYDKCVEALGVSNASGGLKTLKDIIYANDSLEALRTPVEFHKFLDQEEELLRKIGYEPNVAAYYIEQMRVRFDQLHLSDDPVFDQDISGEGFRRTLKAFSEIICDQSQDTRQISQSMKLGLAGFAMIVGDMLAAIGGAGDLTVTSVTLGIGVVGAGAALPQPEPA